MTKLRKCPKCSGTRRVLDTRCSRCNGFGRVVQDEIVSFQPEVTAIFSLKDNTFLEVKMARDSAQTHVILDLGEPGLENVACTLHHVDTEGVFHYEEA